MVLFIWCGHVRSEDGSVTPFSVSVSAPALYSLNQDLTVILHTAHINRASLLMPVINDLSEHEGNIRRTGCRDKLAPTHLLRLKSQWICSWRFLWFFYSLNPHETQSFTTEHHSCTAGKNWLQTFGLSIYMKVRHEESFTVNYTSSTKHLQRLQAVRSSFSAEETFFRQFMTSHNLCTGKSSFQTSAPHNMTRHIITGWNGTEVQRFSCSQDEALF